LQRIAHNISENVALCSRALIRPARLTRLPQSSGIIVVALALVAGAAVSMPLFDATAVEWASGEPHWFRAAFEEITRFGLSGWFLLPCGFALLFLAAVTSLQLSTSARAVLAALGGRIGYVFLAIGLPGLFVSIVKRLIGRARPFVGGHEDPFYYAPSNWHPAFASMPSGHATTAVAAAIAIGAVWPRTRIVMWFYAAAIMVSRVAVLAHHPSDVIGGALVALVGTHLLRRWFAARGLVFRANDLGAKPAPSFARVTMALRQAMSVRNPAA
jgi:membrane-associated phospholipid phosphatase